MKLRPKFQQRLQIWWPAAAVLVVGSALSGVLWHILDGRQSLTVQERLEEQAYLFTGAIEQQLYGYGDIAQGMRLLLEQGGVPVKDVFNAAKLTQEVSSHYPGLDTMLLVRRMTAAQHVAHQNRAAYLSHDISVPDHDEVFVIDDVWSLSATRAKPGMDVQSFPVLQNLLMHMQEATAPRMSGPLAMRQERGGGAGVLISVPLRVAESGQAQSVLMGVLNLSVRVEHLIAHYLARGLLTHTLVSIRDLGPVVGQAGAQTAVRTVFMSEGWQEAATSVQRVSREVQILGRPWVLEFVPNGSVLSMVERFFPALIGACTLAASLLLAAVVVLVTRQRQRAQAEVEAKQQLLRERTDRLNALFHQSAIGVAEIEPATGCFISTNTRFADVVGFSAETLAQMSLFAAVHPDDRAELQRMERGLCTGRLPYFSRTQRMLREDGGVIWVDVWVSALLNSDDQPTGRHIMLLTDVTERRQLQEQLQAREAYSSEMLRYMPVGLVVVGPQGNIEFVNHQFEVTTGWSQHDMSDESSMWRHLCGDVQQHTALLQRLNAGRCEVVPNGVNMPAMEYLLRSKSGQELAMEVSGRFLGGRILLSFVDVSQRKAAEEEIQWLGFYDTLTQLPNRRLLLERLGEALSRSQRNQAGKGALLLLDLDNFKSLNETLGHQHGDALLRLVATRLSNCIAGRHTLARQGGDEFAVVLEDLPTDALEAGRYTEQVGGSILEALRTPFYLGNQDFHVTVSMGAVVFGGHADSVEELLKRADLALYQAKSAGRDTLQFFDPRMQQAVSARVEMEKDMRLALERHEFDLFFQPQVQKDQVIGAEALLRWKHPIKGVIAPVVFVPAAEDSGLILPLGEWVLFAACRQLAQWAKDPVLAPLTMSVNVSPRQFYQPNFVAQVEQALLVTGARPSQLELELTEGMLLTDVEDTISKMVQLKALGVIFSLDDFGTGYSSLSYLKRLPLDKLKIDQSFVREVGTSTNDAVIVRSIIALGHSLGLQVIAEGVEHESQREFLADSGCHYWQGFYFGRPQPATEFEAWARAYGKQSDARCEVLA